MANVCVFIRIRHATVGKRPPEFPVVHTLLIYKLGEEARIKKGSGNFGFRNIVLIGIIFSINHDPVASSNR